MASAETDAPARQIIRALSQNGSMTAAQMARSTGLARSTISTAVSELKDSRIVVESTQGVDGKGSVGRPGVFLSLNPDAGTCVGIHLGYEEVQLVVADLSHSFIAEETIRLGLDYTPADVEPAVRQAVDRFYKSNGLATARLFGIGVSVSGPVRPDGVLQRGGILPKWAGVNIRDFFQDIFRRPVITDNESNCGALAEMKWGAARGVRDFVLFKMDVGVGGAIVTNGNVLRGASGSAGEFGHVSIDPDGDLCRCGNRGCLELYASFVKPLSHLSRHHRRPVTMDEAIMMAETGDRECLGMIRQVGEHGGRGLAMIGTMINPPLIIVGGRMALAGALLLNPMIDAYRKYTLVKPESPGKNGSTVIKVGKFTENDSLLGAVGLVLDHGLSNP